MRDKVVVVTGGGSGLGEAICERLAADGAVVVVNDLRAEPAERVASRVDGEAAVFDVADSSAFDEAVDAVVARHGRVDVMVNNAGIAGDIGTTAATGDEAWDRMLRVHLYGTFHGTRAALRHMQPAGSGSIINMASIAGIHGIPMAPAYSAAKGGIVTFTKATGREVAASGVRVNAVAPAFIDTPLLAPMGDAIKGMLEGRHAVGRLGRAGEVAEMVRFLAGEESSFCFGEVLTVTGGYAG